MNQELKAFYVAVIKHFYGNSVYATEAQITESVAAVVDEMLDNVQTCTMRLAPLSTFVTGIAGGVSGLLESFGIKDAAAQRNVISESLSSSLSVWMKNKGAVFGAAFLKAYISTWFDILVKDRRMQICINTAALNYKSRVAMALMGI